jgi:hypothetical protein
MNEQRAVPANPLKAKKPDSCQLIGLNSGLTFKRFSRIYYAPAS